MAISDIQATPASNFLRGPTCTVCVALAELPENEAQALRDLLGNPAWRYAELSERLGQEGLTLGADALSRHARGRCQAREKLRGAR